MSLVPADERRETDDERDDPDGDDEKLGATRRHEGRVVERAADGQVTVERDGAQVEDRRRAQPDVNGQPSVTPRVAERPIPQNLSANVFQCSHSLQRKYLGWGRWVAGNYGPDVYLD